MNYTWKYAQNVIHSIRANKKSWIPLVGWASSRHGTTASKPFRLNQNPRRSRGAGKILNLALFIGAFFFCASSLTLGGDGFRSIRHVIDGDTVVLEDGERVRLIGINAPELGADGRTADPFALEATLALRELVEGKQVRLVYGKERQDSYGRTLAYIDLPDGTDVQNELIARGYGVAIAISPNVYRVGRYFDGEKRARAENVGIWSGHPWLVSTGKRLENPTNGFVVMRERITKVNRVSGKLIFTLAGGTTLLVPFAMWDTYWGTRRPADYQDQTVEARGWLIISGSGNRISVNHPLMMQIL